MGELNLFVIEHDSGHLETATIHGGGAMGAAVSRGGRVVVC